MRLVVPFCLGIVFCFYHPLPLSNQISLALFSSVLLLVLISIRFKFNHRFHLRWIFGLIVIPLYFLLGYTYANFRVESFSPQHYLNRSNSDSIQGYKGTIITKPEKKKNGFRTIIEISFLKDERGWHSSTGKILTYITPNPNDSLTYGDQIIFFKKPSNIPAPANFDEFDYKRYLSHHYIYDRVYLKQNQYLLVANSSPAPLKTWALKWRKKLIANYQKFGIEGEELAILSALTLGQKENLTPKLKAAYSSAGAMHVLAVSGLHVGIIYLVLNFLLSALNKIKNGKEVKAVFLIISIWMYALITGFSPSVIRAATMFTFMILAVSFKRKSNIYNTLFLSALCILLYEPFMILEVGFQLSYLAVIGIIYLHKHLYQLLYFRFWLWDKAWEITCVSISAQLVTAPLGILYFHQFPTYFLFSNLIVIPAAFLLVFLAIAFQTFSWVPLVNDLLGTTLNGVTKTLNYLVKQLEHLPGSLISGLDISVLETWILYLIILSFAIWLTLYKNKWVIPALFGIFMLFALQTLEKFIQSQQREITIFDTGRDVYFQLVYGKEFWHYGPDSLLNNPEKMQFHIWHHNWNRGLLEEETHVLNPVQGIPYLYVVGKSKFLLLSNEHSVKAKITELIHPDILYINTYKLNASSITQHVKHSKTIIIGNQTPTKTRNQITEICDSLNISWYALSQHGAIKLGLNDQLILDEISYQKLH